jgi:hypothetical protein
MIGASIRAAVEHAIEPYATSRLAALVSHAGGPYVIKFVNSRWASAYSSPAQLKISENPALTWGTATYVTPLAYPLSSALYGRIGLVTEFDPTNWNIFDATKVASRMAYVRWTQAQPAFSDLVLTVHSTYTNHLFRNKFRRDFRIDCVLFHPDQEAEIHTDRGQHVWMAVTDWKRRWQIDSKMSKRLARARFVVLIDEDFALEKDGLPIQTSPRLIERVTQGITMHSPIEVAAARVDPNLPGEVIRYYQNGGYLHVYIRP